MPELPEVETTRRGISIHLLDRVIDDLLVHHRQLRWPVPAGLRRRLRGASIQAVGRRGKYLIIDTDRGHLLVHLGMSGSLRIDDPDRPRRTHDHLEWRLDSGIVLRFHDPRRFGSVHWTGGDPLQHPLLHALGPEPLSTDFDGGHLYRLSRKRTAAVKNFIMDAKIVVGVGNIYASEALFLAGIHPGRAAGRIALTRYRNLAEAIKTVLSDAIHQGGTTLRDFINADGEPGYFRQQLNVYEKAGRPCPRCGTALRQKIIGQRASYYCPRCQR